MTEFLFILFVLMLFAGLIAFRYRRQLNLAWQFWKMLRGAQNTFKKQSADTQPAKPVAGGQLVRCETCRTWTPKDTAISFGPNDFFCSAKCMERAAR